MQRLLIALGVATLMLATIPAQAQEAPTVDSTNNEQGRRWGILPVPAFASAPETGWYIGAVALFTYNPQRGDDTRTSNGSFEFNYTQMNQWLFEADWNVFGAQNKTIQRGLAQWLFFPEFYWGVGSQTPENAEELFSARRLEFSQQSLWRVRPDLYVGPSVRVQWVYDVATAAGGLLEAGNVPGNQGGLSAGLGYQLTLDQRQNPLNAKQGAFVQWEQLAFGSALGSDFGFWQHRFDGRVYLPVRTGQTLALQGLGQFSSGQVPFRMLGLIGGSNQLRGYYQGRFRDQHLLMAQAEYRAHLFWRLGLAAFAGVGNVAPALNEFGNGRWKRSLGLGLRFLTDKQEDINLRFDMAWGQDTFEFYIAFGEAF